MMFKWMFKFIIKMHFVCLGSAICHYLQSFYMSLQLISLIFYSFSLHLLFATNVRHLTRSPMSEIDLLTFKICESDAIWLKKYSWAIFFIVKYISYILQELIYCWAISNAEKKTQPFVIYCSFFFFIVWAFLLGPLSSL